VSHHHHTPTFALQHSDCGPTQEIVGAAVSALLTAKEAAVRARRGLLKRPALQRNPPRHERKVGALNSHLFWRRPPAHRWSLQAMSVPSRQFH
jgi:hypothetical protein